MVKDNDRDKVIIIEMLAGGDRRSIGRSGEVVDVVNAHPPLFGQLIEGMIHPDPIVCMRAADAAEKVTVLRPELLQPYKDQLLSKVALVKQKEVRWHMAQMLPRLSLSPVERRHLIDILMGYLEDDSLLVKTFAMQGLADLVRQDPRLRPEILPVLTELSASGSPAMQSRGRKLLKQLAGDL